jgi:hypothetical protein
VQQDVNQSVIDIYIFTMTAGVWRDVPVISITYQATRSISCTPIHSISGTPCVVTTVQNMQLSAMLYSCDYCAAVVRVVQ